MTASFEEFTTLVDPSEVVDLATDLITAKSDNPPGDTREVIGVAERYAKAHGLPIQVLRPAGDRVNALIEFQGAGSGPHVVLNGHVDAFPTLTDHHAQGDVGGVGAADAVIGRGAVDMKGGVASLLVAVRQLHARRDRLRGRVSMMLVCDEETAGPFGSRHLLAARPDLYGDVWLSAEPSSLGLIRYGERGAVWSRICFQGTSAHGAYRQPGANAIEVAGGFIGSLRDTFASIAETAIIDRGVEIHSAHADERLEELIGLGATDQVRTSSLSVGRIYGGASVNMAPRDCTVELDVRVPVGSSAATIRDAIKDLAAQYGGKLELIDFGEPNHSDPEHAVFGYMSQAVQEATGREPGITIGIGCTEGRLWRQHGTPAAVFGPSPLTMAADLEYVTHEELSTVAFVHARTAYRLLTEGVA